MYETEHFREDRTAVLHRAMQDHPLALLVLNGADGPVANLLPLMVNEAVDGTAILHGHMARANPAWRLIMAQPELPVLAVFQGPQGYITPSWYETKRETGKVVPTWKYVMVQARGLAHINAETDWLRQQVTELTVMHERDRDDPWAVNDAPDRFIDTQLRGIVGIEITVTHLTGKWKMSQNRTPADRAGVKAGLDGQGDSELAKLVV